MKNYKQLIKELPSKSVVFAFGRFNPPTIGHELLVRAVRKLAQQRKADHVIYASASHDAKKNPLDVTKKVGYLRHMFPNTNFVPAGGEERTFIEAAKALNKRYKNIIMIAGSDRVPAFKKLLNDYNGKEYHFDTIEVVSAGERDPDADDATGMSASKMRALAVKGDYLQFKKGLPTTMRDIDGRRLMNDIRQGMGLELVKEQLKLVKDELREQYFRGEVFKLGDIVESAGEVFKIIKRGSNHLLVEDQIGNRVSKWIQDVSQTEKAFMLHEDLTDKTLKVSTDKIKVARIIATMMGIENAESMANPEALVNQALRKARQKALNPEALKIIAKMLTLAQEVGIKYDDNLKPQKLKETVTQAVTVDDSLQKKKLKKFKEVNEDVGQGAATAKTAQRQAKMADLVAKQAKEKEDMVKRQKKESDQLRQDLKIREAVKDDSLVHKDTNYNLAKSIMRYSDYKKTIGEVPQVAEPTKSSKETESDHDAIVGDTAPQHTHVGSLGHSVVKNNDHNLRRRKIAYHLGEETINEADTHELGIRHDEPLSRHEHIKSVMAKHGGKVSGHSDKATYISFPADKVHAAKKDLKAGNVHADHWINGEMKEETIPYWKKPSWQKKMADAAKRERLAREKKEQEAQQKVQEETEEQAKDREEEIKRFKKQAEETKLTEDHDGYCPDEYASGEIDINSGDIHNDMSEEEIEDVVDGLTDEDYLEVYDDEELAIVDAETGEETAELDDEKGMNEGTINEVLSRMERMRARIRIRTSKSKRQRAEKIALKRYSDTKTINKRARRLAIKLMKKRFLRGRPMSAVSVPEKERLERMIEKRKAIVSRIATRLAPRIRRLEKNRLSHSKYTTGTMPSVF